MLIIASASRRASDIHLEAARQKIPCSGSESTASSRNAGAPKRLQSRHRQPAKNHDRFDGASPKSDCHRTDGFRSKSKRSRSTCASPPSRPIMARASSCASSTNRVLVLGLPELGFPSATTRKQVERLIQLAGRSFAWHRTDRLRKNQHALTPVAITLTSRTAKIITVEEKPIEYQNDFGINQGPGGIRKSG